MLKDGYYVSTYTDIDSFLHICGRSMRHDHNLTLWRKSGDTVELVQHWELERLTGIKHHEVAFASLKDFRLFLDGLLQEHGLSSKDILAIFGSRGADTVTDYYNDDYGETLTYHAAAHLFSSLMYTTSNHLYEDSVLSLSLDGGSDLCIDTDALNRNNFMGMWSSGGKNTVFPIPSPGLYWSAAKQYFGLEEGTLMALAYATTCRVIKPIADDLEPVRPYNLLESDAVMAYVKALAQRVFAFTPADEGVLFCGWDPAYTREENKISMVMKLIQALSIDMVDEIVCDCANRYAISFPSTYLSLSGGYALNCPSNTHLMHRFGFKGQLVSPAINDGGQAVGIGLQYFYKNMPRVCFETKSAFLGCADKQLRQTLARYENYVEETEDGTAKFVDDILEEPVVWFEGRAEIGPRALGHRSILADAGTERSKELLNTYKRRQWWRPVAPIVLEDYVGDWFQDAFPSPYMLNNFVVRPERKALIPAVLHHDGTARVQTINPAFGLLFHLIEEYRMRTNIPMLCNTSLNDRGEPIVNTIEQALNFALRKGIRVAYVNGTRILLRGHKTFDGQAPSPRDRRLFPPAENASRRRINPYGLAVEDYLLLRSFVPKQPIDLCDESNVKFLKRYAQKLKAKFADENGTFMGF